MRLVVLAVAAAAVAGRARAGACQFCVAGGSGGSSFAYDLSSMPTSTFTVVGDSASELGGITYFVTSPCANVDPPFGACCENRNELYSPAVQDLEEGCLIMGLMNQANSTTAQLEGGVGGFNLTVPGTGPPDACGSVDRRRSKYVFVCDMDVPATNGPESVVQEEGCEYTITWRTPAACGKRATCSASVPPPPPAPVAPPASTGCTPPWNPTWNMSRSTILYACNASGFLDVGAATRFGAVVIDWSNAKDLWVNAKPMNDEELLTLQAEQLMGASPSIPGEQPRVWVYRNTIKALNWYTSVRVKLDDPAYAGWFIKFKDYHGPSSNNSYHVPACTYEKCSGFYHDQEQTPEYPSGDGSCSEECDCGDAPCGEYIFDHRNASFKDWFINEYMITNETLLHDPIINLGWLDDSMQITGPTEEDKHFINDTGSSPQDMQDMVDAYNANIAALKEATVKNGGFYWQMIRGRGPQVKDMRPSQSATCASTLRSYCTDNPAPWNNAQLYQVQPTDAAANVTQYTSEFLLTRGPYAWIGYGWLGCSGTGWPFFDEWSHDYGQPEKPCFETGNDTGIFQRDFPNAEVTWDCNLASGSINMKAHRGT